MVVDKKTIEAYSNNSAEFINRYLEFTPTRLYQLAETYFIKNEKTLDLGCASGRDTKYLNDHGFPCDGLDVTDEFVIHCRKTYPSWNFFVDSLPHLSQIPKHAYVNILVSAVLMHISSDQIEESVKNLLRILKPGGRIIISIREKRSSDESGENHREADGRLFSDLRVEHLATCFEKNNGVVLLVEQESDTSRLDITWKNLVITKRCQTTFG